MLSFFPHNRGETIHARAVVNDWRGRFSGGSSPSSTGVRVTPSFLSPLLVHNHHVITSLFRKDSVLFHPSNPAQSLTHRFRWKMLHSSKSATTVSNCINVRRTSTLSSSSNVTLCSERAPLPIEFSAEFRADGAFQCSSGLIRNPFHRSGKRRV